MLVVTGTCLGAIGCGAQSRHASVKPTAASRLTAVCDEAGHELLTIDRHKIQPDAQVLGRLIEEAAEESERVDKATVASVRRLPTSTRTAEALADLARSRVELQAIVRVVRRHGISYADIPQGLPLHFLEANGGCGRVQIRKPTTVSG
jgi:hypothetical protein